MQPHALAFRPLHERRYHDGCMRNVQFVMLVGFCCFKYAGDALEFFRVNRSIQAEREACSGFQVVDQVARRVQRDDLAVINDTHAVAELLRFIHIVRGENDGLPFGVDLADELPKMSARLRVQARCGLIKEHHVRVVHQRGGNGEPMLLPAGQFLHQRFLLFRQVNDVQEFIRIDLLLIERSKKLERLIKMQLVII